MTHTPTPAALLAAVGELADYDDMATRHAPDMMCHEVEALAVVLASVDAHVTPAAGEDSTPGRTAALAWLAAHYSADDDHSIPEHIAPELGQVETREDRDVAAWNLASARLAQIVEG